MQYTQDYDEKLPYQSSYNISNYSASPGSWVSEIYPYVKSWQIFRCPSSSTVFQPYPANPNSAGSYLPNGVLVSRGLALSAIDNSAEVIMTQEWNYIAGDAYYVPRNVAGGYQYWIYDLIGLNHFDGGNLLYTDGHVKWRKQSSVAATEFGLVSNVIGPTPGGGGDPIATARF